MVSSSRCVSRAVILLFVCVVMMPVLSAGSRHQSLASESALQQFLDAVIEFRVEAKKEGLSSHEKSTGFEAMFDGEAERLKPFMPGILEKLGKKLAYRSPQRKRLDKLLLKRNPTDQEVSEAMKMVSVVSSERTPLCPLALMISRLGGDTPAKSVALLLGALPLPERSDDECIIRSLVNLGPGAYPEIIDRVLTENKKDRVQSGSLAIVLQTIGTEFPGTVGIEKVDEWEDEFPTSIRGQRKLIAAFRDWWSMHATEYNWNPTARRLEAKNGGHF